MIVADISAWIDYVTGVDASDANLLDYELLPSDRDFDPMDKLLGLKVRR